MIDFLEKKDLGEIMKIAKQEPDIKKAVKEMLELLVGRAFDLPFERGTRILSKIQKEEYDEEVAEYIEESLDWYTIHAKDLR